jgi:hypothetical protein
MNAKKLPENVATEADILAESVNSLPEDTLRDALVAVTEKRAEAR